MAPLRQNHCSGCGLEVHLKVLAPGWQRKGGAGSLWRVPEAPGAPLHHVRPAQHITRQTLMMQAETSPEQRPTSNQAQ
eukprot:scaffold67918_cov23-Tisochrysis_lutea.AAC.3